MGAVDALVSPPFPRCEVVDGVVNGWKDVSIVTTYMPIDLLASA